MYYNCSYKRRERKGMVSSVTLYKLCFSRGSLYFIVSSRQMQTMHCLSKIVVSKATFHVIRYSSVRGSSFSANTLSTRFAGVLRIPRRELLENRHLRGSIERSGIYQHRCPKSLRKVSRNAAAFRNEKEIAPG